MYVSHGQCLFYFFYLFVTTEISLAKCKPGLALLLYIRYRTPRLIFKFVSFIPCLYYDLFHFIQVPYFFIYVSFEINKKYGSIITPII
jgi:hypothetical protein